MAITGRSRTETGGRCADATPARGRVDTRRAVVLACATAAALPMLSPSAAHAQRWVFGGGIGTELTWSSNPELAPGAARDDTILDVRPHVSIRTEGGRVQVNGTAALNAITTANHTQPSRILPEADLSARAEAIQRFLFLEGGVRALQTSVDPFGARPEPGTSTSNTLTMVQTRFTPRIESQIGPDTRYRLSSSNSWTREMGASGTSGGTLGEGYFGRHAMLVEHDPRPLGWRLEAERSQTRYRDDAQPPLTLDLVRASVDYAFGTDWTVGVRAGRERTSLLPDDPQHTIFGVQAHWQPSPRTTLDAFEERRFFGKSWKLAFENRLPHVAWNVAFSRTLDTSPQSLFDLPASNDVPGLLDAALAGRFPDPIERARIIQDMLSRQGLPTQTLQPLSVFTQRVSIVTTRSVGVVLLGVRNSVALRAFALRTEDATEGGTLFTGDPLANNSQYGASATLSHRFTPTVAVNASAEWSRIRAIGADERSIQRTARVRVAMQAGPRTNAFAGLRYRKLDSNVVATGGQEGAVFVGLDHTF